MDVQNPFGDIVDRDTNSIVEPERCNPMGNSNPTGSSTSCDGEADLHDFISVEARRKHCMSSTTRNMHLDQAMTSTSCQNETNSSSPSNSTPKSHCHESVSISSSSDSPTVTISGVPSPSPTLPTNHNISVNGTKCSPPPAYRRHDPCLTLNNLPSYSTASPSASGVTLNTAAIGPPQKSPNYQRHHTRYAVGYQSAPHSPASSHHNQSPCCNGTNACTYQCPASAQRSPGSSVAYQRSLCNTSDPHSPISARARPRSAGLPYSSTPHSTPPPCQTGHSHCTNSPDSTHNRHTDYLPSYEEAVGLVPPRSSSHATPSPSDIAGLSYPLSPQVACSAVTRSAVTSQCRTTGQMLSPPLDSVSAATASASETSNRFSVTPNNDSPSATTQPHHDSLGGSPPVVEPPLGYAPLQFKDFTPQIVGAFFPVWEKFDVLVGRANQWLYTTRGIRVRRCESVLGLASRTHGYNPSRAIGTVSKTNNDYTYNVRFLRVWYEMGGSHSLVTKLIYRNLTASNMLATTSVLIALLNRDIKHAAWMDGTLVSIESIFLPLKQLNHPNDCVWVERVGDVIPMAYFLRVFGVQTYDDTGQVPPPPIGSIGFMDFVPQESQSPGSPHNVEPFSMLMRKVNSWITHERPRVHLLNIESLQVKRKSNQSTYWQRLHYTYYAADKRTLRKTFFTQIIRVYYMTTPCIYTTPVDEPQPVTYRVFMPVQLTSPKSDELKFESLEKTVERIHIWLSHQTGVRVMSMETIAVRMYTGGQERHGAESCLSWCDGRVYSDHEHWIYCIRLYIRGCYHEPEPWQLPETPNVRPFTACQPPPSITLIRPTVVFP